MEIYAEISKSLLYDMEQSGRKLLLPEGITMNRKSGSRSCYFECADEDQDILIGFLNDRNISWQIITDAVKKSDEKQNSREWGSFKDPWNS